MNLNRISMAELASINLPSRRAFVTAPSAIVCAALAWLSLSSSVAGQVQETDDPGRPYADGPLARADYALTPPADLGGLLAWTYADIRHHYNYRVNPLAGRWQATPTDLSFTAIILPNRSWNADMDNAALMQHEQGHFDITEIHARQAQDSFASRLADPDVWGNGPTREAAVAAMAANMKKLLEPMKDDFWTEQKRYDAETRNGRDPQSQQQWNRLIAERLKSVASGGAQESPDILALLRQAADGKGNPRRKALEELGRQRPKFKQTQHQLAGIWQMAQVDDLAVARAARKQMANAFERAPISACLQWLANDDKPLADLIWKQLDARIERADKARLAEYRNSARKALEDQDSQPGTRAAAKELLKRLD